MFQESCVINFQSRRWITVWYTASCSKWLQSMATQKFRCLFKDIGAPLTNYALQRWFTLRFATTPNKTNPHIFPFLGRHCHVTTCLQISFRIADQTSNTSALIPDDIPRGLYLPRGVRLPIRHRYRVMWHCISNSYYIIMILLVSHDDNRYIALCCVKSNIFPSRSFTYAFTPLTRRTLTIRL